MKEFIFYSILISLLYVYSGIGLTFLLSPRNLEKYSLYLSSFVGLSYLSYFSWFFAHYGTDGTDVYAKFLLLPPIIFLIAAMIVKKGRISKLLWPFRKENLLLIIICIIIFAAISMPYLLRVNGLNAMVLYNEDITAYATVSKFLTKYSLSQPDLEHGLIPYLAENNRFGAIISTSIPSSIFSIEPYRVQNISIYLFFFFGLPIVFLVGMEIFGYKKSMAMIITLLSGISFHLLYINYIGFLGQVIGMGMFLSFFLLTIYPILNCDKLSCFKSYVPLSIVFAFGLLSVYSPIVPLLFIPLFVYLLLFLISTKSVSTLLNSLIFLSLIIFVTFVISPGLFINQIKQLIYFTDVIAGWDMPVLSPDWVFGLVGDNIRMQQIPIIYRSFLSIPIVLVIIASFVHLFKKERRLFYLSISYISFILFLYIYLIIKEASSPSFTGDGYKAYKIITYFIPIILLIGLSYFRDFHILPIKKITKTQMLGMAFLFLLIAGNLWSASAMINNQYYNFIKIKDNIIDLQKISKIDNVSSINIMEASPWDQMWMYYFLFMEKKIYLKYYTYYPSSPLNGEWTLQKSENNYFKMNISFPSGLSGHQEPIITTGKTGAGDFIYVNYISDGKIAFRFEHWGVGYTESLPILIDNKISYPLEVVLDRSSSIVIIKFEGKILRYSSLLHPTVSDEITIGENRIGGTGPEPRFSGKIQNLIQEIVFCDGIICINDIEPNIIEVNTDYYLLKNNLVITLSKGWYGIESNKYSQWRWTGERNETPAIELDVRRQEISMDILLNYWPLNNNNEFSVFLDEQHIKDCKDNKSCLLNDIVISKGKHEIAFKSKLPPRSNSKKDPRILGYAFSDININIRNVKT